MCKANRNYKCNGIFSAEAQLAIDLSHFDAPFCSVAQSESGNRHLPHGIKSKVHGSPSIGTATVGNCNSWQLQQLAKIPRTMMTLSFLSHNGQCPFPTHIRTHEVHKMVTCLEPRRKTAAFCAGGPGFQEPSLSSWNLSPLHSEVCSFSRPAKSTICRKPVREPWKWVGLGCG